MELARSWMRTCHQSHIKCFEARSTAMPSRLLDVTGGSDVRVVEMEQSAQNDAPYAALSYCWGNRGNLRMTQMNKAEMMTGMKWNHLPLTLQDAILVCRELDIQYLWIDSLCITQDDPMDLANVLSQMPRIYKQAGVTISASRATCCHEGFLKKRTVSLDHDQVFRFPYQCSDGKLGSITAFLPLDHDQYDITEPIERRGWTLQEALLSPRLLDFGSLQTSWQCMESDHGAAFIDGWVARGKTFQKVGRELGEDGSLRGWEVVAHEYSRRLLTNPDDKLLAIAAMAEEYGGVFKDMYLAGLWKKTLPSSLLWQRDDTRVPIGPRLAEYRAPSWAWTSIDNPFADCPLPITDETQTSVEILDCQIRPKLQSLPYGAVDSGFILIKGRLNRLMWSSEDLEFREYVGLHRFGSIITADASWDAIERENSRPESVSINGRNFDVVFYMEIHSNDNAEHYSSIGLLLFETTNGDFKRTGLFCFQWWLDYDPPDSASRLDMEHFREWFSRGEQQSIRIV
jgi:hypothetical protein